MQLNEHRLILCQFLANYDKLMQFRIADACHALRGSYCRAHCMEFNGWISSFHGTQWVETMNYLKIESISEHYHQTIQNNPLQHIKATQVEVVLSCIMKKSSRNMFCESSEKGFSH